MSRSRTIPEALRGPLFEASADGQVLADEHGVIHRVNAACTRLLGYSGQELIGRPIERLVPARFGDHARQRRAAARAPRPRAMGGPLELAALHRNGHEVPVDIALTPVRCEGQLWFVASLRDMRRRAEAAETLRVQATALRAAANGVVITDRHGVISWVNPAASRITGYAEDELVGRHTRILKSGVHDRAFYGELWSTVTRGDTWSGTIVNRRKDGSHYFEEQTIAPVVGEAGEIAHFIAIKQDVSARLAAESALAEVRAELAARVEEIEALNARLRDEVIRDPLTGLYNRRYYQETIQREFAAARRRRTPVAIAIVDVDRFKKVNDDHGHAMGDAALVALAGVLTGAVRSSDLVCRFGGDEFAVVLPGADSGTAASRAQVLRETFGALRFVDGAGVNFRATVSIGVAASDDTAEGIDALMARADGALYQAKRSGRDRVVVSREDGGIDCAAPEPIGYGG